MGVVIFAAVVLFGLEAWSLFQLKREAEFIENYDVENPIGDAYLYDFINYDYEKIEEELERYADDLAYAI